MQQLKILLHRPIGKDGKIMYIEWVMEGDQRLHEISNMQSEE
jgi:hypothetical protein